VQPAKPTSTPVTLRTGFHVPTFIPDHPVQIIDEEPVQYARADSAPCNTCVPGGIPGDPTGGGNDSLIGRLISTVPTEPVIHRAEVRNDPPKPPAEAPKPRRVTSVEMAKPIHRVDPVYPRIAVNAGISGTVELLGVLGVDGRIHELRVIKGHPLLIAAAIDAVKQWIYRPTILNGQPVEVSAPIQVNFILHR
jgi:periplasmic protein TonB